MKLCELYPKVPRVGGPNMPISSKYKVIFFHIPRTGGTSIAAALEMGNTGPFVSYTHSGGQHLTPQQLLTLKRSWLLEYFKFTFIRNPYDRLVSEYFWRKKRERIMSLSTGEIFTFPQTSFDTFICKIVKNIVQNQQFTSPISFRHFRPQCDFVYNDNQKSQLDFVGRFENIQKDFNTIVKKLGIKPKKTKLPRKNYSNREKDYRGYYNKETRQIVSELYKQDLETFNYEF